MIDKSIRADYDIKNRRRYFTGAFGGAGAGRGRDPGPSGPPGGGDRQMTYTAPAPSPHRDDSAERAAQAATDALNARRAAEAIARENEAREVAREKAIQVAALTTKTPTRSPHRDTQEQIIEQKILDDYGYQDLKAQAPKTFAPPIKTYERGVPFLEDELVKTVTPPKYGPTYYQDRSKIGGETWGQRTEDMMPRGGIMSAIGGGLKKIFGDNPLEWALNIASFGGYEKAKYAKMLLGLRKKGSISNTAYKKVKSFLDIPKEDAKKLVEEDIRDKDGIATQIAKGTGLESGAELLGLKERDDLSGIEGQQAVLGKAPLIQMRMLERKIKAPDIYGKPTPKEERMYKKLREMDKEEKVYKLPILTAADGGRIDRALAGRNRYI